MKKRIAATNWDLNLDEKKLFQQMTLRRKLLQKIEDISGWRIGEYKNYKIIK